MMNTAPDGCALTVERITGVGSQGERLSSINEANVNRVREIDLIVCSEKRCLHLTI